MAAFPAELSAEYPDAVRIARHAGPPDEAEDVAAEAFARVVAAVQGGRPVERPGPYLRAAVRNGARDARRGRHRTMLLEPAGPDAPAADEAVLAEEEAARIRWAFDSLPERYREVLWATEVEGKRPAQLAAGFALSANGVAALAYRAREALRLAWLSSHAGGVPDGCRQYAAMLGASCRGRLPRRHKQALDAHLAGCPGCRQLAAELMGVNSRLRGVLAPAAAVLSLRRLLHPAVAALAAAGVTALVVTTLPYTASPRPTPAPPAAVAALPATPAGPAPPLASASAGARPASPRHTSGTRAALAAAASTRPGTCATPRATPSASPATTPSASPATTPSPSATPTATPSPAADGVPQSPAPAGAASKAGGVSVAG